MDPLAELVKIDPKSIGVGQYQHDVDQHLLKAELDTVVESAVNTVGVNLNTASKYLLNYVSGIGETIADNIVQYRKVNGEFKSRLELKKVARLGDKSFEQCAGFLRIKDGENPLDNTAVHPERYVLVSRMAKDLGCTIPELIADSEKRNSIDLKKYITDEIGLPTLQDILHELTKPGLDPRSKIKIFEFAKGITKPEHLQLGMRVPGIVTNITKFGAFVDIGVKQDGLIHLSNLANRFVSDASEIVKLNQQVQVKIIDLDLPRKRIGLSLKEE
jgi:protein Tex